MSVLPTLLLAEDDDDLARMLATMLRKLVEVVHVRDGREALEWLVANPTPSAIVTDRAMPRVDGIELVRTLKADPVMKHIPILMLTAYGDPKSTVEGINAGVRHYVSKPFKTLDLQAKVEKMLKVAPAPVRPPHEALAAKIRLPSAPPAPADAPLELDLDSLDIDLIELDPDALELIDE